MFRKIEIIDTRDDRPADVAASYSLESGLTPAQVVWAAPLLANLVHQAYAHHGSDAPLEPGKSGYLAARLYPLQAGNHHHDVRLSVSPDLKYRLDA